MMQVIPASDSLRASVIIPARDAASTLGRALDALAGQERPAHEVVVVDDGSRDGTAELAEAHSVVDRVVRRDGGGPGAARNAGAAATSGDVLAFTDADCFPDPSWLAEGVRAIAEADLVQGAVWPERPVGVFDRSVTVAYSHGLFETANLLLRRELFDALGGFEPWLMPVDGKELGEDVWLGWRAVRSGARVTFCASAVVRHAVFERGARGFVAERTRLRHFPAMAARIPELRDGFFYARFFLTRRSAAFDAATAGLAVALLARRPAAAIAAAPYASMLVRAARPHPWRFRVKLVAALVAADAVGARELLRGSAAARTILL
jgi:glycosyltransferase involved in cell wall biosynthesis